MFEANRGQKAGVSSQGSVIHFSDLKAWQSGHQVVLKVYKLTVQFPKSELFGLVSQMRRAAVSITSNLAEGFGRSSVKEKLHFYSFAHGSLTELENQIIISKDIQLLNQAEFILLKEQVRELDKIISGLMRSTQRRLTDS